MNFVSTTSALATALAAALAAQQGPGSTAAAGALPALRIPIHSAPADPTGGEYGLRAAGPDYKVAFHDGFEFVPLLGKSSAHNLPLTLRTKSIARGGVELLEGDGAAEHDAWRFERRWPAVTERYDVRIDGVEQSFVVHAMPQNGGDLVVTMKVASPLTAVERAPRAGALTFADPAGRAIVEYGAGIAFDAVGRVTQVATGYAAGELELVVDRTWLDGATLPITIDPLVRTVIVESKSSAIEFADVVRDDDTDELFYVFSFAASAGDIDQVAWIANDALTQFTLVFSDLSTSWDAVAGQVTVVGGADRFALAMHRFFHNSLAARVRVYLHDAGDHTLNSGRTLFLERGGDRHQFTPAIGGSPSGSSRTRAVVAFREDAGTPARNTDFSRVDAVIVDCVGRRFLNEVGIGGGTGNDAESPSVNRFHDGAATSPWVVAWQEHTNRSGQPWISLARQVFEDASVTTHANIAISGGHHVHPRIEGAGGRYLAVWLEQPNTRKTSSFFGFRVEARRLDWANGASQSDAGPIRTVAEHPSLQNLKLGVGRGIAFDTDTDSHWMVSWSERDRGLFAARLGFDSRIAESIDVRLDAANEQSGDQGVCYDDDRERFVVAYTTHGAPSRTRLAEILMPAAQVAGIGTNCPGRLSFLNNGDDLPFAGSEFAAVQLAAGTPNAPSFLLVGFAAAASPLPLPGSACSLALDPGAGLTVLQSGTTDGSGRFRFALPLPSLVDGEVFVQAVQLAGNGIAASDALQLSVR